MAVVAVAADSARYDAMDTTANTNNIGGGAGEGVENDIVYQGTASISRKVTGGGFYTTTGAARNLTTAGRDTWIVKTWLTNYGSLTTTGNIHEVRVGSGTGAYYNYTIGSPTVDYPARGGWVIEAIDPSIASHRSGTTGSPVLTACDYFAAFATCSTSKAENLCLDAIDVGVGLYLTGGDGVSTDGTFADFVADDEGDITNGRFGYVFTQGGIPYVLGRFIVGATSSSGTRTAVATGFTDSNGTVVWSDHRAAAGFSGLTIDLGNATTTVDISGYSFVSRGTVAGEDTRAVLEVFGTSGSLNVVGGSVTNFASALLTSASTFASTVWSQCGLITAAGANLTDCTVSGTTASAGVLWNVATDPDGLLDGMAFESDGSSHAVEFGSNTPASIGINGWTVSGYATVDGSTGNEVIYNNSGKAITINVANPTGTLSVRNGAGASTTIVLAPATLEVTALDNDTGSPIQNVFVTVWCTGTGDFPSADVVSIVRSGSTATVTHTGHGLATNDKVRIAGCAEYQYNINATITVTGVNTYTYQVQGTPATPATGSPVSSLLLIEGYTDATGKISDTRTYTANQDVTGRAAKGTSSPVYITGPVTGTVNSTSGLSVNVSLVRDGA